MKKHIIKEKMSESIKAHIIIDQTETLEPEAHCYISDLSRKTNYKANLEQISTIITLQDLIRDKIDRNEKIVTQITSKLGIHKPENLYKLQNLPIEVFYYLNADGGNENLSTALESINTRVHQNKGHIYSFGGSKIGGSAGFAFFSGISHSRYHTIDSTSAISLNMLESYFISQQTELENNFELFYEMQEIINKKKNRIQKIILDSSKLKNKTQLQKFIQEQMDQAQNTYQKVTLNNQQLAQFEISQLESNHYQNLSTHLNMEELELTLCIQKVYDFLNSQSITYH